MKKKKKEILVAIIMIIAVFIIHVIPPMNSFAGSVSIMSYCPQNDKMTKEGFTIIGNLSTKKGSVNIDGAVYSICLKMESKTSIQFTTQETTTLKLYIDTKSSKSVNIDGKAVKANNGIITKNLSKGTHTITKKDVCNLFYLDILGSTQSSRNESVETEKETINQEATESTSDTTIPSVSGNSVGMATNIGQIEDSDFKNVIYVAPNANGNGSKENPMDLESAISKANSGTAILLLDGTYTYNKQITIENDNNGTSSNYKALKASKGAKVILDFSSESYGSSNNERGLQVDGSYWYIGGITIKGAADNGMLISGMNNVIERVVFEGNRDSGLQISRRNSSLKNMSDWPANNLILNCTSFNNSDPATHENADGFAPKLTCGNGNVFDGCISYCNCDDGWDLYAKSESGSIGVVTIRNCVSIGNGTLTNGETSDNGDKNGFKLGGSNNAVPTAHIISNCLAINNGKNGFTDNGNGGKISVTNCTSVGNAKGNFNFSRSTQGGVFANLISASSNQTDKFIGTLQNVLYVNSSKYLYQESNTSVKSGDKIGVSVSNPISEMYNATDIDVTKNLDSLLRNSDGTINMNNNYTIKSSSIYTGCGVNFGNSASETKTINVN